MFTQPRDPNNKHKPAYKNIVHIVIEQITPSLLVSRNNEMMKIKGTPMLDLNLSKNHLYNTSALLLVTITLTEQTTNLQNLMIDTVVEVHHVIVIQIATIHHKIDITLTLEKRYRYDSTTTTPPQFNRSRYDNYKRDSRSHRSPYRSSYRSPYRQDSRHRYKSRSYSRDRQFPQYTSSKRSPSQPRQSRLFRSRSMSETRNKINNIQTEQSNSPINFEFHMYHPTEMANALTPTSSTLYIYILLKDFIFVRPRCFHFTTQLSYLSYNGKSPQYHM